MANNGIEVEKIAKIARITLEKNNVESCQNRLETVVNWLNEAKQVDVTGFKPMIDINQNYSTPTHNTDFSPAIKPECIADLLLNNKSSEQQNPEEEHNYFTTILVIE